MEYYSFYKDEWNRISYLDFNGSYPDQTSNWLILFRYLLKKINIIFKFHQFFDVFSLLI
jgi:hypothetical protein